MPHKNLSLGQSMTAAMGLALTSTVAIVAIAPVHAATLDRWQFDPNTHQLVMTLPTGVTPQYYLAAEPARIIIDLPQTEVGAVPLQQAYIGGVRQIRVAQFQPGVARIVLELSPDAVLASEQVELKQLEATSTSTQWALRPLFVGDVPVRDLPVRDAPSPIAQSTPVPVSSSPVTAVPEAAPPSVAAPATAAELPAAPANLAPVASTSESAASETAQSSETAQPTDPSEVTPSNAAETPAAPPEASTEVATSNQSEAAPAREASAREAEAAPAAGSDAGSDPESIATHSDNSLPPLEPGAIEIPIEAATASQPTASQPTAPSETSDAQTAVDRPDDSTVSVPPSLAVPPSPPTAVTPASVSPVTPELNQPEPNQPSGGAAALSLPPREQGAIAQSATPSSPLSFPTPTSGAVTVPSIDTVATSNLDPQTSVDAVDAAVLPPATMAQSQPPAVPFGQPIPSNAASSASAPTASTSAASPVPAPTRSAPTRSNPTAAPTAVPTAPTASSPVPFGQPIPTAQPSAAPAPTKIQVIPFGQPLPTTQSRIQAMPGAELSTASLAIPSGTVLKLRYSGETALELGENPHQEVLLLEQAVSDQSGNVILPAGSPVIGRFETSSQGSQFIAQAVEIQGKPVALNAQSDQISGERQVTQNGLLRNSAIGAVAGTLLGAVTGVGLIPAIIAGAASSAATTYVTAPDAATVIQPNQVVEVRLTQDWLQSMQ